MPKDQKPAEAETALATAETAPAPLARTGSPLLQPLREILASIPEATEDPMPRMMAAIAAAPDAQSWEDLFSAAHFKDNAGKRVRVHGVRVMESQYPGRLGIFLLADVTYLDTGEETVMTIGSEMAMAQLANCHRRGDFPHDFEIVKKDRPTKAGFFPMRLRSIQRATTGDPAEVIEGTAREVPAGS